MSEQPKRRFWQVNLSSLVLLAFVAAGLLYANVCLVSVDTSQERMVDHIEFGESFNEDELKAFELLGRTADDDTAGAEVRYYGIPYARNMYSTWVERGNSDGTFSYRMIGQHWNASSIVFNLLLSLGIFLS